MFSYEVLPTVNAALNLISTVLLLTGFILIKQKRVTLHRIFMSSAFLASVLFLVSYLVYHAHAGAVHFTGTGTIRTVYFTILITHTILAALVPFLAIITLTLALRKKFDKHRKLARWTLPVWLYVSATGVVIYLMLYHL
jgi:uncharacterized membrane protein YozB (DUF420 family)